MANFVIKKNGERVPFDSEKIKNGVTAATLEAGLSDQEATDIAGKILSLVNMAFEGQEEVATTEVRDKILSELDEWQPVVAQSWRKYEEGKGE